MGRKVWSFAGSNLVSSVSGGAGSCLGASSEPRSLLHSELYSAPIMPQLRLITMHVLVVLSSWCLCSGSRKYGQKQVLL